MEGASTARDRKAERHQTTRREVLEVAWRLAAERGLTGWTLGDVAAGVGMRAPSLYVYFASKNDLYDALFADGYRQMAEAADRVDGTGPPLDLLRRVAHFFVDFCAADAARYQLLFLRTIPGFEPSPTSYVGAVAMLDRSREVLAAAGASRQKELDLWTALLTGLASQQISNDPGGNRWRRLTDDAVDMFVATRITKAKRRSS